MKLKYYYHISPNSTPKPIMDFEAEESGRDFGYLFTLFFAGSQQLSQWQKDLDAIQAVEVGDKENYTLLGNDVEAEIRLEGVQISITLANETIDQPEGYFSLAEFKTAVTAYIKLLHMPKVQESCFEIEV